MFSSAMYRALNTPRELPLVQRDALERLVVSRLDKVETHESLDDPVGLHRTTEPSESPAKSEPRSPTSPVESNVSVLIQPGNVPRMNTLCGSTTARHADGFSTHPACLGSPRRTVRRCCRTRVRALGERGDGSVVPGDVLDGALDLDLVPDANLPSAPPETTIDLEKQSACSSGTASSRPCRDGLRTRDSPSISSRRC